RGRRAVEAVLVDEGNEPFGEERITEPRHLLPAAEVEHGPIRISLRHPCAADGRVDTDSGLLTEKHRVGACRYPHPLEVADRDLHGYRQQVEALEAVDAVAVLAQAVRQAPVVVQD